MTPRTRALLVRAVRAAALAVVALACARFVRRLDVSRLGAALVSASVPLVALAAAVNLLQVGVRALFLRALLAPVRAVGLWPLCRYNLALFAGNNLLPARAGELVRIELLRSCEGVPPSTSLVVAVVEKVLDVIALLLLALPLPLLVPGLPRSISTGLGLLGAGGLIALAAAYALARWGARAPGRLGRLARGAAVVRRGRSSAEALGWSLLSHAVDAAAIAICLAALDLRLPAGAALLVLLAVTLALALPSGPAGLGSLELGAVAALRLLGVDETRALAFALVYHAMQVIPVTLLGLNGLRRTAIRYDRAAK
ncbi:MAG TPA: lysylphosphatidylglycerol synthase transmembrane domain-containing protein [Polyangia bacterium]|nr:lysylphosphatidylglycerol synthase transmembrane domain-containing protein [Polyangia bacterium]